MYLLNEFICRVANKYDALFDEPDSHSIEDSAQSIYPESNPQPTLNGNHAPDSRIPPSDTATAPMTDVSSGIAHIAQFLPDHQNDSNSLFDGSDIAAPTSILPAVEAPVSDLRQDKDSIPSGVTEEQVESSLGNMGTAASHNAKIVPSRGNSDVMDVSQDLPSVLASGGSFMDTSEDNRVTPGTELPDRTGNDAMKPTADRPAPLSLQTHPSIESPSQIPLTQSPTATDQDMAEAPSSGKVRTREDDEEEEDAPSAKRTKTEEEDGAGFKIPGVPAQKDAIVSNGNTVSEDQIYAQPAEQYSNSPMTKAQNKFLLERIRNTKKIKVAFAFRDPVDPDALGIPQYRDFIKEPMDLGTMEQRLKDDKYASMADFMKDMNQIIENTVKFNGQEHPITQAGLNMRAYFIKGLVKMPKTDIEVPLQRKVKRPTVATVAKPRRESRTSVVPAKSPTVTTTATSPQNTWPLNSDGMPLIRRDSSNANDRPKREIHRPPPKDLPYNSVKPKKKKYQLELKFCESVVTEMMKSKHAKFSYPFLKPVDPVALNIPQYLKIIKKPMDLGTVEKNLKDGNYQTAKDFYTDVMLMFNNCYKFNPETDDVHKMGKTFQQVFDSLWAQKQAWIEEHTPVSEPQSPATADSEDEEEEEEEVDDEAAKLMAIQQQIAQLNNVAQALLQQKASKRASPKASTKKGTKNAKPVKSRKNSTLPPPKAAPKAKARTKPAAPLTFSQKQEISDAISTLGDSDMRKAVQIIRNGCPHLAVSASPLPLLIFTLT